MGLLSFLKAKESHTHFERNSEGDVVEVYRSGDEPKRGLFKSRTPVSDSFEKEYYKEHPEKRLSSRIIKAGKTIDKRVVSKMQPIDTRPHSSKPSRGYSIRNNYNPFGSMFDSGINRPSKSKSGGQKYAVVGGKAYPIAGSGKKKKSKKSSKGTGIGFSGFNMTDNFGYMKNRRK